MPEFIAIIVAAGTGSRAGNGLPKQYRRLGGKPVLRHSVDAFLGCEGLKKLYVVVHPDHRELARQACEGLDIAFIDGGSDRRESVARGLDALSGEDEKMPVLIHDAARPFIDKATILTCVQRLQSVEAVTVAAPVVDTLRVQDGDILTENIPRDALRAVQTPQGFHYGIIKKAHDILPQNSYTDDSQMVSETGTAVHIVEGSRKNMKLTTEDDFQMTRKVNKTGLGYDVHAFGETARHLRIGGVDIPHNRKLLGHSDADVLLHAITDAIYGTIGSGDIGSHFPPSKTEFKDMDSAIFLKKAMEELTAAGGEIVHIDTVVICEEPKIGPHRETIRAAIANICGIPLHSVSVKATTSEGLGFTGRREGIAAQALVTIEIDR